MLTAIVALCILSNIKQEKIMATLENRFDGIEANLTEASTEIQKQIGELRDAQGTLTPEQEEKLSAIEATAQGLANIVPNADAGTNDGTTA